MIELLGLLYRLKIAEKNKGLKDSDLFIVR